MPASQRVAVFRAINGCAAPPSGQLSGPFRFCPAITRLPRFTLFFRQGESPGTVSALPKQPGYFHLHGFDLVEPQAGVGNDEDFTGIFAFVDQKALAVFLLAFDRL